MKSQSFRSILHSLQMMQCPTYMNQTSRWLSFSCGQGIQWEVMPGDGKDEAESGNIDSPFLFTRGAIQDLSLPPQSSWLLPDICPHLALLFSGVSSNFIVA
jgi:hypothetical protein